MPIPSEIQALIDRLNQEFERTEADATEGLNLVKVALSRFPDNVILMGFFGYLNTALLFVEIYTRQVQATGDRLSRSDVTEEEIQEAGEDLGTLLGRVLETKIQVAKIVTRLEELQ